VYARFPEIGIEIDVSYLDAGILQKDTISSDWYDFLSPSLIVGDYQIGGGEEPPMDGI
jgi:hypothetical protein